MRLELCYTVMSISQLRPFRSDHSASAAAGVSEEQASLCGSLSFSDSTGRWKMVSINSSEQHGWLCSERAGGVVMAACRRSAAHDYGSLLQVFPLTALADAAVP